jgi:hypothetical protein
LIPTQLAEASRKRAPYFTSWSVRYLDIYEGEIGEAQFVAWVKQASELPGERL